MMVDIESNATERDTGETDSVGPESAGETPIEELPATTAEPSAKKSRRVQLSISLRTAVISVVIVALISAVGLLAWLYIGAKRNLDDQARQSENKIHAENVALHYAVEAAAMSYQDLNTWKGKLVAGTSPELKDRLTKAATSMEQILVPLRWDSTSRPLAAKVRTVTGGVYVVDSFVSVLTKTAQAPEPLQSTATYSITVDSGKDWQITDVGGVGDALGQK